MGQKACSEYLNSFVEIACAEVQEDWCFHCARVVQDQDTHQGCHQSLHQTGLRQGDEGGCEACEENLQSLPCGCSQEADLNGLTKSFKIALPEVMLTWESHEAGLEDAPKPVFEWPRSHL